MTYVATMYWRISTTRGTFSQLENTVHCKRKMEWICLTGFALNLMGFTFGTGAPSQTTSLKKSK